MIVAAGVILLAWAGWTWFTPFTMPWALAEMPLAVAVLGLLLREVDGLPVGLSRAAPAVAARRRPDPDDGVRHRPSGNAVPYAWPTRHDEFLPPVVSLDDWRTRRSGADRPGRRAA